MRGLHPEDLTPPSPTKPVDHENIPDVPSPKDEEANGGEYYYDAWYLHMEVYTGESETWMSDSLLLLIETSPDA